MNTIIKQSSFRHAVIIFTGIPLLLLALNFLQGRSLLKDILSIMTILVFYQMLGMVYWSRVNRYTVKQIRMPRVIRLHKSIGYVGITILLFHPLFLILPKFFEFNISGIDALMTILSTINPGIVTGMVAWGLMLLIGITAMARKQLPMTNKTWRYFHGILAANFILFAAWHVIDLGRHSSMSMSMFIILLTAGNILLIVKHTLFNKK